MKKRKIVAITLSLFIILLTGVATFALPRYIKSTDKPNLDSDTSRSPSTGSSNDTSGNTQSTSLDSGDSIKSKSDNKQPPSTSSTNTTLSTSSGTTSGNPATNTPSSGSTSEQFYGWNVSDQNVGLAPFGLSCASLPLYTGPLSVPKGTTISNVRITGKLDLSKGNISIIKSCIQPTNAADFTGWEPLVYNTDFNGSLGNIESSMEKVRILDSEIDGSQIPSSNIAGSCGFHGLGDIERNYIHGMGSGICLRWNWNSTYDGLIVNNYVTALRAANGSHNEAATIRDFNTEIVPSRKVTFQGNRLNSHTGSDSGALFIQAIDGTINNTYLLNNLFEGGGYSLVLGTSTYDYGRNMNAQNNRFYNYPGDYGPTSLGRGTLDYGWNTWSDNYMYDASAQNAKGAFIPAP